MELTQKLYDEEPSAANARDLAVSHYKLGSTKKALISKGGREGLATSSNDEVADSALNDFLKAAEILQKLHDAGMLDKQAIGWIPIMQQEAESITFLPNPSPARLALIEERVEKLTEPADLGNLSFQLLEIGVFDLAAVAAEKAIQQKPENPLVWVEGNRASAYLFLNRMDESMELHRKYRGQMMGLEPDATWEQTTKGDFGAFRKIEGLVDPKTEERMREVEVFLGIREDEIPKPAVEVESGGGE
ncbi:MAG: hypothetical protein P1U89_27425, partial [Verrucomicrobiales bacterium]|nr:hypothetical protein [Verrucomicrobiales bacterium]